MIASAPALNAATLVEQARAGRHVLLADIPWASYVRLGDQVGEQPVRLTFDRGKLEIMTLSRAHEIFSQLLGHFVVIAADVFNLPLALGGSMTFRREDLERGLEPDNCYWIAHAPLIRGRLELDFTRDPPPDLAVEIEISRSLLDRIAVYGALHVPELWRSDGEQVSVGVLQPDQTYRWGQQSPSFPKLPIAEMAAFLRLAKQQDHLEVLRAFRAWLHSRIAAGQ